MSTWPGRCVWCEVSTGRREEDALYTRYGEGPLCVHCARRQAVRSPVISKYRDMIMEDHRAEAEWGEATPEGTA